MRKNILLFVLMLSLIFNISTSLAQRDTIHREQGWSFGVSINDVILNSTGYLDELHLAPGPLKSMRHSNLGLNILLKFPIFDDEKITQKNYSDYFLELKRNTFDVYFKCGFHNLDYNFYRRDKELVGTEDIPEEVEIESKFNISKDVFYIESGLSFNTNFNLEFFGGMRIDYSLNPGMEYRETIINPSELLFTNGQRTRTVDVNNYLTNNKYNLNLLAGVGYEIYPSYLFNLSLYPQIYFGYKVLPEFKEKDFHFYYANFGLAVVFHNDRIIIPVSE